MACNLTENEKSNINMILNNENILKQIKGEKMSYIGDSIAHNCDFDRLARETGVYLHTLKAYGSVRDDHHRFPNKNFETVVQQEIVENHPTILILQASSVDIHELAKRDDLSLDHKVQEAKNSSYNMLRHAFDATKYNQYLKLVVINDRIPCYDGNLKQDLMNIANEELYRLANIYNNDRIFIGKHQLKSDQQSIHSQYGKYSDRYYDGWHLKGPKGKQSYTTSVLTVLSKILLQCKHFDNSYFDTDTYELSKCTSSKIKDKHPTTTVFSLNKVKINCTYNSTKNDTSYKNLQNSNKKYDSNNSKLLNNQSKKHYLQNSQ